MFLNCYPYYWIFVPMLNNIVQQHNMNFHKNEQRITLLSSFTTVKSEDELEIDTYLRNIPLPPIGYGFSKQQIDEQRQFFKNKEHEQLPHLPLDLYNASVIVVRKLIVSFYIYKSI